MKVYVPEGLFWFLKADKLHHDISQLRSAVFSTFKITAPWHIRAHFGSSAALHVSSRDTEWQLSNPRHSLVFTSIHANWLPHKAFLPVCVWQQYQKAGWHLHSETVKEIRLPGWDTYSGWKIATGLEFLQGHGAGVSAKKEDERHEGDVRDIFTVVAHKLASIFQALLHCQRWPVNGGIVLERKREGFHKAVHELLTWRQEWEQIIGKNTWRKREARCRG